MWSVEFKSSQLQWIAECSFVRILTEIDNSNGCRDLGHSDATLWILILGSEIIAWFQTIISWVWLNDKFIQTRRLTDGWARCWNMYIKVYIIPDFSVALSSSLNSVPNPVHSVIFCISYHAFPVIFLLPDSLPRPPCLRSQDGQYYEASHCPLVASCFQLLSVLQL